MVERQQEAYRVAGVDESQPAIDLRKRKAEAAEVGRMYRAGADCFTECC